METDTITAGPSPANLILLFTLAAIAVMMLLEALLPRRQLGQNMLWRWSNNFSLASLTWIVSALCSAAVVVYLAKWTGDRQFGLIPYLGAGPVAGFLALLVVTQFIGYWVHVAFHKVPWLWPIHAIHHSDVDVDVSTSYRHHPLEPLLSLPLVAPAVLLLGATPEAAVGYKLFEVTITLFSHSNVRLPEALDRQLRRIVLTPDFHRLHHCAEPRYTNSNYGSVVPWFDYLFGTASARPYAEQESMLLGLEYLRKSRDGRLDRLVTAPFHWKQATEPGPDRP